MRTWKGMKGSGNQGIWGIYSPQIEG